MPFESTALAEKGGGLLLAARPSVNAGSDPRDRRESQGCPFGLASFSRACERFGTAAEPVTSSKPRRGRRRPIARRGRLPRSSYSLLIRLKFVKSLSRYPVPASAAGGGGGSAIRFRLYVGRL